MEFEAEKLGLGPQFFKNEKLLIEILFRYILWNGRYKADTISLMSKEYIVYVRNTILQFNMIPIEKEIIINVNYDLTHDRLDFSLLTTRMNQENYAFGLINNSPYFILIHKISQVEINNEHFDIKDSILEWDAVNPDGALTGFNWLRFLNDYKFDDNLQLSFNPDSSFLKLTDHLYHSVIKEFKMDISKSLFKNFNLRLEHLNLLVTNLNSDDEQDICDHLTSIMKRVNSRKMLRRTFDLCLQITQYNTFSDIDLKDYEFEYSKEILELGIANMETIDLPHIIISFKQQLDLIDGDEDYDANQILREVIEARLNLQKKHVN